MIKLIFIFITLFLVDFCLIAQDFPGKDVELLAGREIRVKELSESLQKYGYDGFYKDENLKRKFACCQNYKSKYNVLVNKVFKVTSFQEYKSIGTNKFKLKLENPETGIIYYDYQPEYEHSFPFEVIGGLIYPDGFFCKHINKTSDKFTDKISYNSPLDENIILYKIIENDKTLFFMRIEVYGSTISVNKEGAIILLKNGIKIVKPKAEINVDIQNHTKGYSYSTFILLDDEDIEKLTISPITDVRLYVYDRGIKNGLKFMEYLKCLLNI